MFSRAGWPGSATFAPSLWIVGDVLLPRSLMRAITIAGAAASHTQRVGAEDCSSASTAFPSFLDTYATHLLAQPHICLLLVRFSQFGSLHQVQIIG